MKTLTCVLLASASVLASAPAMAAHTVVDFTTYPYGTSVTSIPGASVSLYGGPDSSGAPTVNSFGTNELGNSNSGDYPTAEGLLFSFTSPVKNISFVFDNFGDNNSFGAPSMALAFIGAVQAESQNIGSCNGCTVNLLSSGITSLRINNGSGGGYNWEYGLRSISFDAAGVPEPATWALMIMGFGLAGGAMRRRVRQSNVRFDTKIKQIEAGVIA